MTTKTKTKPPSVRKMLVVIRVNAAEHAAMHAAAAQRGFTLSQWLRRMALAAGKRVRGAT